MTRRLPRLRHSARRLAIFNHKGGVGKTFLTVNIATEIARLGNRVLLIDSDPQCNLTSYLFDNAVVDDLLDRSDTDQGRTLWTALKPIIEAVGTIRRIEPYELSIHNLFLVPGDIRLSEFETELSDFWGQCLQRKTRGFRGTTALSQIVNHICVKWDVEYVFYDCGPNIGPLNRAVLLDCDYFIVPVACDLFSVRALKTLGRTLANWIREWKTIADLAPEDTYLLPGMPAFVGYIPQRIRVYGGKPALQHSRYLSIIEKNIQSELVAVLREVDPSLSVSMGRAKLGEISDFATLVTASQHVGVPLSDTRAGTSAQREAAKRAFRTVAERIVGRTRDGGD